jgi:hypothetical protein
MYSSILTLLDPPWCLWIRAASTGTSNGSASAETAQIAYKKNVITLVVGDCIIRATWDSFNMHQLVAVRNSEMLCLLLRTARDGVCSRAQLWMAFGVQPCFSVACGQRDAPMVCWGHELKTCAPFLGTFEHNP